MDNSNRTSRCNVVIALVPVEKLSKKLQDKGILEQEYKED
jgi:hypothetical protein